MKILLFIDHLSGFGGAQRVIVNVANKMNSKGNEVIFVLTGNSSKCVYHLDSNVKILLVQEENSEGVSRIKKIKKIRQIVKKMNPDVVISFLTMVNIVTILSTIGTRVPVIISERNDPVQCSKTEKCLSKVFYRFSDCVVVQTKDIKNKISSFYKKRIDIIENPLVDHNYEKTDYSITKKVVAVGRLNKQKNYYLLLNAFREVLKEYPDYKLDIYGAGDELEALQQKCMKEGLSNSVCFKGNEKNIIEKETRYDFYVMSSDFEGMPNALAEALSVGLPCISTNCDGGGAAALICNNKNGVLVPKGDVGAMTNAMKAYIVDPSFAKRMGENAKEVRKSLSHTNIMYKWETLIEEISKV